MLKEKKLASLNNAMDKAPEMEKHVSSIGKTNLLCSTSTSHSSHTWKNDKSSRSMNVDSSLDPMQTLISSMMQMMKQQTTMMQMMQDQMSRPREYSWPSYEQPRKFNNTYEGKRNFDQQSSSDYPKKNNIVREESPIPEREEWFYSLDHDEEEVSPTDDYVHMLTEEDIDALFTS